MKVDVVVDVGNSQIKWGRCAAGKVAAFISLPPDDPESWARQIKLWQLKEPFVWILSGVDPHRRDKLADWLRQRGNTVRLVDAAQGLPLTIALPEPDKVGIDRLLKAVAANDRVQRAIPKILIDVGSAVTVDLVDAQGAFCGGAIFPGPRLMAQALHDHTALLPVVTIASANPILPGRSTVAAIEAGVFWAVAGGIKALVRQLLARAGEPRDREVFLAGGGAALLAPMMDTDVILWPEMTLEGLRLTAEALP
jgi:type III pantothenate kinase